MDQLRAASVAAETDLESALERGEERSEAAFRPTRHTRRLFDKILVGFHHACDVGDLEVAERLLPILDLMTTRRQTTEDTNRRRSIEGLVAAHERLWHLRHPTIR